MRWTRSSGSDMPKLKLAFILVLLALGIFGPHNSDVQQGWAAAIPAVTSIVSGLLSKKGASKQQKQSQQQRQYALTQLSQPEIQKTAQWLFPGLLSPAARTPGPMQTGRINTTMQRGGSMAQLGGMIASRAQGGPLAAGQTALVGEQGPEVITPTQPINVTPNPATKQPSGAVKPMPNGQGTPSPMSAVGATIGGLTGGGGTLPGAGAPTPMPAPGTTPGNGAVPGTGTTVTPTPTPQGPLGVGSAVVRNLTDLANNPGQISSAGYERQQEEANRGLNTATSAITGGLTGRGIDPSSGMGQLLTQSAVLNTLKQRNEANRDFTLASDALRREDITNAANMYQSFLQTIFGLQSARANTATGSAVNFGNPYAGIANGIATAGYGLGKYFESRSSSKSNAGTPTGPIGSDDGPG